MNSNLSTQNKCLEIHTYIKSNNMKRHKYAEYKEEKKISNAYRLNIRLTHVSIHRSFFKNLFSLPLQPEY
jgi:hypothetical protein